MTDRHDIAPPGVPNAETAVAGASPGGGRQAPLPRMPNARENAMAIDQVDRTVVTHEPTATGQETVQTSSRRTTTSGPGGTWAVFWVCH